jgi:hypothetical protein
MTALADLHRSVQATLGSKRLGTPVFARYLLQRPERPEAMVPRLAQLVAVVRGWLDQPLDRLYAQGTTAAGHITLALDFRHGATALVSLTGGPPRGDGIDLMVLGNQGALYHDGGASELWDEAPDVPRERPEARLVGWIEQALRSGRPEPEPAGGKP